MCECVCVCDSLICLRFLNTGRGWNRGEKWKCQHTKNFSWGWFQSTKHSWVCCNNKEVEASKCSLLSACGFRAKLTGLRPKLGRRHISFEVILMPAIAVRISKSGEVYIWLLLEDSLLRLANSQMPNFTQFFMKCGTSLSGIQTPFSLLLLWARFQCLEKETVRFDIFIVCPPVSVEQLGWKWTVFVLRCVTEICRESSNLILK